MADEPGEPIKAEGAPLPRKSYRKAGFRKKRSALPVSNRRRMPPFPAAYWAETTFHDPFEGTHFVSRMYGVAWNIKQAAQIRNHHIATVGSGGWALRCEALAN